MIEILPADGTTAKSFFANLTSSVRIDMIGASSDDTAAKDVQLCFNDGTSDHLAWTVTVPVTAGTIAATPSVNMLNRTACPWVNADGAIILPIGTKLRAKVLTAVTAAKVIRLTAIGGVLAG